MESEIRGGSSRSLSIKVTLNQWKLFLIQCVCTSICVVSRREQNSTIEKTKQTFSRQCWGLLSKCVWQFSSWHTKIIFRYWILIEPLMGYEYEIIRYTSSKRTICNWGWFHGSYQFGVCLSINFRLHISHVFRWFKAIYVLKPQTFYLKILKMIIKSELNAE